VLLEEESSRTHFILGDVDRIRNELERDVPLQEGDSGVTLREGTRSASKAFEEQTKRLVHVKSSLQVHEMEIEAGKKLVRFLGNRVTENNRNHLELVGEIEANVKGFAEAVEATIFAKEAHKQHQAKEEVPDPIPGRGGIRAHHMHVCESTGANAPDTAFTSSDLRGESIGSQQAFDVGVQVHTDDVKATKRDMLPCPHLRGRRGLQRIMETTVTRATVVQTKQTAKRTTTRRKVLPATLLTVKKLPLLASPRELMAVFVQTPGLHQRNPYPL